MMNNKNDRIEQDGALAKLEGKHSVHHGNSLNRIYMIRYEEELVPFSVCNTNTTMSEALDRLVNVFITIIPMFKVLILKGFPPFGPIVYYIES